MDSVRITRGILQMPIALCDLLGKWVMAHQPEGFQALLRSLPVAELSFYQKGLGAKPRV